MQKKFFTNLVLVLVLNALVKPFYILGIDAEVLKQVEAHSPGSYGEYFSLIGFTFILNIFLDLGITNYNTRNIAQNNHLLKKHFSGIITLRALLSLGYMALLVILGLILGYSEHQFELLGILGLNQILASFLIYFRSNLAGLLLFKQDSFISVLDKILLILICSVLLWGGVTNQPFKIQWFVYAQTFAYAIAAFVAGYMVIRKTGRIKLTFNPSFSGMIIKQSLPYALLILLMIIYYRTDGVMLERMLPNGKEEAAIYARGYRFFEALNMVGYLFAGLLLPIFAKLIKGKESIHDILYFAFKLILSFSITTGIISFFYQAEIMEWRFETTGQDLIRASKSFGMLMICFIFMTMTYIFGTLLTANGSLRQLNIAAGLGVVLNIGLNLYLIPKEGAYGAAIASLITQGLTALIQVYLVFKIIDVKINWRSLLTISVFAITVSLIGFSSQSMDYHWAIKYFASILISSLVAITSGMVSIKGIVRLLDNR